MAEFPSTDYPDAFDGNDRNFPLPLLHGQSDSVDPWAIAEPEPTNLILLLASPEPPTLEQVIRAFNGVLDEPLELLDQPEPDDPRLQWLAVVQLPDAPAPVVVWVEPMRPLPQEHLEALNAHSVKWALGLETVLRPDDPLTDFMRVMRLLGKAYPDAPAMLNVNIESWYTRKELDEALLGDIEPRASVMWMVHAIGADQSPDEHSKLWVYTQGLSCCGRPELEMLEVPYASANAATMLLNNIAELLLEGEWPLPGEPFEIANNVFIAMQPWQEAAQYVSDGVLGGMKLRKGHDGEPRLGVRAAVCAPEPIGTFRKLWVWPEEAVRRFAQGDAAIYRTRRATIRQAMLARQTWPTLISAFKSIPAWMRQDDEKREIAFLVQVGFAQDGAAAGDASTDREHVWFEIIEASQDRARGRLINQPLTIADLKQGQLIWIERDQISDWQALTRSGPFGPETVGALREVIGQLTTGSRI